MAYRLLSMSSKPHKQNDTCVKIKPMLHRMIIHLSLIILFAFTQIGVVTHEISHLSESEQHQEDQHNHSSECKQCLSDNHASEANLARAFSFEISPAEYTFAATALSSNSTATWFFYSARAPPTSLI